MIATCLHEREQDCPFGPGQPQLADLATEHAHLVGAPAARRHGGHSPTMICGNKPNIRNRAEVQHSNEHAPDLSEAAKGQPVWA